MYSGHAAQADSRTGRDRPRNRAGRSGIWRMATSGGSDAGAPVVLALVPTCFAPPGGKRSVRQSAQAAHGADATGADALLPSPSQRSEERGSGKQRVDKGRSGGPAHNTKKK